MKLTEIFEHVLIESGQFLIPSEKLELKIDPFRMLAARVLGDYTPYKPLVVNRNLDITGSRQFTFTEANTPEGVPEWISDLVPIRVSGVYPFYLRRDQTQSTELEIKSQYPYKYRKPTLTVPIEGTYDVERVHYHKLIGTSPETYEIPQLGLHHDEEFFDMLTGRFMMALGRSRTAFTLQPIEISTDAETLTSEGKDLYESTKNDLEENKSKFYLAWV